ncbi:MAG TPA: FGGY-family carbohydrate kinase [Candidatus Limnocylindria bacterium]|nr:FGGY-family carbohydrate kinase [Candidatus Limnocylindria bacterium]
MTAARRTVAPLVLAVDIGSSSVRAAVHDRLGRMVTGTAVQVPYAWDVGPHQSVRLSREALLEVVGQALDQIAEVAKPLAPEVVAGGISCFLHSIAGLDAVGQPVTPVLSWADSTSTAEASALRDQLDPAWAHRVSGVPIHASYWPARVLRLRQEQPRIRRWAGFPDLLAEALTGRVAVSRSMASGTGLLDRAQGIWSSTLLDRLAVDPKDLPPIVADDEPIGPLSAAAARRWPQLAHLSWFAPWGDGGCANVGLGATAPGRAALTVGTSGALRAFLADSAPSIPAGLFAYRLGPGTVAGGQLSEGGAVLDWATRLLGRSRRSLERAAAGIAPDAHGLTVLPYPFGERSLGYHDDARATLAGLHAGTDPAAVYRAFVESIAFGFAAVDDRLANVLGEAPAVIASGGALARSPLLAQVLADSLGRDIAAAPKFEASRHGAALLALRGSGVVDAAAPAPSPRARMVRADPERTTRYRAARARQRALYEAVLG